MTHDPECHRRRSLRVKGYDYAQEGAYFVTVCAQDRACLFGEVVNGEMGANVFGEMVRAEWFQSAEIRQEIELFADEFVVMPNHIHGILWIVEPGDGMTGAVGAHGRAPLHDAPQPGRAPLHDPASQQNPAPLPNAIPQRARRSLGSFIAGFKSAATKRINIYRNTPGARVWQRNYYEHIIRDDESLHRIRQYIAENPMRWEMDRENPAAILTERNAPWPD